MNKGKGKFSIHALQRADMIKLTCGELASAWYRSTDWTLSEKEKAYKFSIYGLEALDDFYTFDGQTEVLFTCHQDGKIIIIITITKMARKYANQYKVNRFKEFLENDHHH